MLYMYFNCKPTVCTCDVDVIACFFRAGYVFEDNVSRRHQRGREQAMVEDPNKVKLSQVTVPCCCPTSLQHVGTAIQW